MQRLQQQQQQQQQQRAMRRSGGASACAAAGGRARAPRRAAAVVVRAAGSTYGNAFRVTTFGESHGKGVGCVVDGVPPRLSITTEEIQAELDRRRPGQSIITTPRKEEDTCEILSGVFDGVTLGTPIAVVVRNKDQRSGDYSEMSVAYRPSHADATYDFKYGIRAVAGGGRSSARETIGRVAAGAIAKKLLREVAGTEVLAYVSRVRGIGCDVDEDAFTLADVESNIVRCPDQAAAQKMIDGASEGGGFGVGARGRGCPTAPFFVFRRVHSISSCHNPPTYLSPIPSTLPLLLTQQQQPSTRCATAATRAAARSRASCAAAPRASARPCLTSSRRSSPRRS